MMHLGHSYCEDSRELVIQQACDPLLMRFLVLATVSCLASRQAYVRPEIVKCPYLHRKQALICKYNSCDSNRTL